MKKIFVSLISIFMIISLPVFASVKENPNIQIYFVNPINKSKPAKSGDGEAINALLKLINDAQENIDFAIYGISNEDEIFQALISAQNRGVKIRGIVDMDNEKKNPYKDTYDLLKHLTNIKTDYKQLKDFKSSKSDYVQHVTYNIGGKIVEASFVNEGIKDYNDKIMHNKYFIIDKKIVWTGSMNISNTCASYNSNSSVAINSKELAEIYTEDFEQMFIKNKHHNEKQNNVSTKYINIDDNTKVVALLLPEDKETYNIVSGYINRAQKYIYVPMFFFTHTKYSQDLINAHNRGVKVKVILDATSARTGYSKHEIMRMAGIPVKIENWGGKMHEKSLIIDDKYLLIGSMNFTSGAHYQNDENSLLIENKEIAIKSRKRFEKLWKSIPDKWLYSIPKPEGEDSKYSCFDNIDNDHDGLIDADDPDCACFYRGKQNKYIYNQKGPIID